MLVVKWLPGTIDFTGFNQPVNIAARKTWIHDRQECHDFGRVP